jgi:DNA invertase Pin-like site-specific DNA recombinase
MHLVLAFVVRIVYRFLERATQEAKMNTADCTNDCQHHAVAYLRTSSATNVGSDKDSASRQTAAIETFAKRAGLVIVDVYYDEAVSGADVIETRPGFIALLARIESNGVRVVIVEDASRFARELMTQELGLGLLEKLGVRVFTANGDELTNTSDPMKKAMRQISGAFAELEKARLVAKLKSGRERAKSLGKQAGGTVSTARINPACAERAKALRDGGMNFRAIAATLASEGYVSRAGTPFAATAIKRMVEG